jgi:hypothetical protein
LDFCVTSDLANADAANPVDPFLDCLGRTSTSRQIFDNGKRRESTCGIPIDRIGGDLATPLFEDADTSVLEPCLGRAGTLLEENAVGFGRGVFLTGTAFAGFVGLARVFLAVTETLEADFPSRIKEPNCGAFLGACRRPSVLTARGGRSVARSGSSSSDLPSMVV